MKSQNLTIWVKDYGHYFPVVVFFWEHLEIFVNLSPCTVEEVVVVV